MAVFLAYASFVVAHWQFAFDYFRLSYKTKLKNDKRPVDTNKCLLDASNYTVSVIIILMSAALALAAPLGYFELSNILFGIV